MGLLDIVSGNWTDDKDQNAAIRQGLLSAAFGAMAGRGNRMQALGQGGLAGLSGYGGEIQRQDDLKQRAIQQQTAQAQLEAQKFQMEAARQKMQQEAQQRQWLAGLPSPQMQANQAALAGGGGPTVANASRIAPVDPVQQMTFEAVKSGALPFGTHLSSLQKDETPITVKEGEALLDRKTLQPKYTNPKAPTPTELAKLMTEMQSLPPDSPMRGVYQAAISKATTHAPAPSATVINKMDNAFAGPFAEGAATLLKTSRDKAQGAANTLRTIDQIDQALASGKVITGPTATPELFMTQLGTTIGVAGKDSAEKLANTSKLMQGAASLAVDGAAALAGQGQITEGERALVNKMSGGGVDQMTPPEIRATLGVLKKVNRLRISQHQDTLKKVDPKFQNFVPFYQVDAPQEAPAGVVNFGDLK